MPTTPQEDYSYNDKVFAGNVTFVEIPSVPAGSWDNDDIAASAGIVSSKLRHRFNAVWSQPNSAATTETRVIYRAKAAGTILQAMAGSIAIAIGDSTVTVDIQKNGVTILNAVITLDSGNVARTAELGTLTVTSYAAGDVFETIITATVGTGTLPTGVFVQLDLDEAAA